jgi:molybdate transport system substrate-binding protein
MRRFVKPSAIGLAIILAGCRQAPPAAGTGKPEITVAAASNLTDVFSKIAPGFETETGIHAVLSFASTAQLARQIENSAPFDVFLAADSQHVDDLEQKGLLAVGTKAIYARGVLAMWIPDGVKADVKRLEDLASSDVRTIAIANPELAPYGQAAVDALKRSGIWPNVAPKVVYAENISMAKQYGASKNADVVFTAYSLVLHEAGRVIRVDQGLHQPIDQELGIIRASQRQDAARKFVEYLLSGGGKAILASYGYQTELGTPAAMAEPR